MSEIEWVGWHFIDQIFYTLFILIRSFAVWSSPSNTGFSMCLYVTNVAAIGIGCSTFGPYSNGPTKQQKAYWKKQHDFVNAFICFESDVENCIERKVFVITRCNIDSQNYEMDKQLLVCTGSIEVHTHTQIGCSFFLVEKVVLFPAAVK